MNEQARIQEACAEIEAAIPEACIRFDPPAPTDPLRAHFYHKWVNAAHAYYDSLHQAMVAASNFHLDGDAKRFDPYYRRFSLAKEDRENARHVYETHELVYETGTCRSPFFIESEGVQRMVLLQRSPPMRLWSHLEYDLRTDRPELAIGESCMAEDYRVNIFLPVTTPTEAEKSSLSNREKKVGGTQEYVTEWGTWQTIITQYGARRVENGYAWYAMCFLESETPTFPFTYDLPKSTETQ